MPGRYTIIATPEQIKQRFNVVVPNTFKSRYNAAPTQSLPVITNQNPEALSFFYWGLIPSWSKNNSISQKLINARSETIHQKAAFKSALKNRRCLVVADGFYEWKNVGKKGKIPYRIKLTNDSLFAFAGLWEEYDNDVGETIPTFTIITTTANETISQIHERMPVILSVENEKNWLDNSLTTDEHMDLLRPIDSKQISMLTVSPLVNNVKNDSPDLIKYAPPADQFGNYTLFN